MLLPSASLGWPEERRRAIVLHELAHLARHDPFIQTMAFAVRPLLASSIG